MTCFSSAAGMLRGEVCCGAAAVEWLEIGRLSTMTSVLVASVVACDGAVVQVATKIEMEMTGWNWKDRVTVKEMAERG